MQHFNSNKFWSFVRYFFLPRPEPEEAASPEDSTAFKAVKAEPGQMDFPVALNELAYLIQFLAMTTRTGELVVHFQRDNKKGMIYFRQGKIYHVAFGASLGSAGLARMLNHGSGHAFFSTDVTVEVESPLDGAVDNLLLDASVQADELIAREGGPLDPGKTIMRPVVNREAEIRTVAGAIRRGMRLWKWVMVTARVLLLLSLVLIVYCGGYLAYMKIYRMRQEKAITEEKFRAEKAEKALQEEKQRQKELIAAIHQMPLVNLKTEIEEKRAKAKNLDPDHGVGKTLENAEKLLLEAGKLIETAEIEAALDKLRECLRCYDAILALDLERQTILRLKADVDKLREKAAAAKARDFVPELCQTAELSYKEGESLYAAGKFSETAVKWKSSLDTYRQVEAELNRHEETRVARAAFESLRDTAGVPSLEKFGGNGWEDVKKTVAAAETAESKADLTAATEKWRQAAEQLNPILPAVNTGRNGEMYLATVANGQKYLTEQRWQEAEAAFKIALRLGGFESDSVVRNGLNQARAGILLASAEEARTRKEWNQTLILAEKTLTMSPESTRAKALAAEARENLLPRLEIAVTSDTGPIAKARILINQKGDVRNLPAIVPVMMGKAYEIAVEVPPDGDRWYLPFQSKIFVDQWGLQKIMAVCNLVRAPGFGHTWAVPGLELMLAPVADREFKMGSNTGGKNEQPVHPVILRQPFWIGRYEVTNLQFRRFIQESGYNGQTEASAQLYLQHFAGQSEMSAADDWPVCYVNWLNATAFCRWLTERERKGQRLPANYVYRLPTEAEWEYCCRAGTPGDFAGDVELMAWYARKGKQTQKVGTLASNPWDLYDMHGNVWEWCQDWLGTYSAETSTAPTGPETGLFKVIRGGSWYNDKDLCRSAARSSAPKSEVRPNLGFRVVLAPDLQLSP